MTAKTRRWPQDPQPFGDDHPSSFLGALYSPDMPNRETSHDDYRSLDDLTRTHRAGVTWSDPVHVPTVRLRWRAGWASRRFRIVVRDAIGWTPIGEWAQAELIEHRNIDREITGVAIEQAAGGGPVKAPGVLRLSALSLPNLSKHLEVRRNGAWHTPQMPLATDGSPWTVLDISDAEQIRLQGVWDRISIDVIRCGDVGGPDALRRWATQPEVFVRGHLVPDCFRWLDCSGYDAAGGVGRLILVPQTPLANPTLIIEGLHATGVVTIGREPPTGQKVWPAPRRPLPEWTHPDVYTLAEAHAITEPLNHAASLGRPGSDVRVGLLPDGGLVLRRFAHAGCVHVAVRIDGQRAPGDGWGYADTLARDHGPLLCRVDAEGVELVIELDAEADIQVSACAREGLWPRPMAKPPFGNDWSPPDTPAGSHTLSARAQRLTLRLVQDPGPGPEDALKRIYAELIAPVGPGGLVGLLWGLLEEAALFIQADDRVCYGLFPSVYADAVFGLEEDYLFRALAYWDAGDAGLRAFRATYLNAGHLDTRHYLHDLRMGLTPWQLWHLLRLTDTSSTVLDDREIALLRKIADWVISERAKTADATGAMTKGGWRVFPGLLPPYRYGGDLDFPTQSLYVNAANWRGLQAVAAITGDDHAAELADYKRAIRAAFEAMHHAGDGSQPLHSGGADPGEYLQLMTCGILDPLQFFAPDDPIAVRIDAQVADDAHLFSQLPRFNGWGVAPGIDAVYCHGYLINALRRGERETFWAGLCGLFAHAFDRDLFTAREVGPIQLNHLDRGHWLPGRRLSRSEPCVGSVGVALMLLRHMLVTEMDDEGRHLRCFAGLLPEWRGEQIIVVGLPTLSGHVTIALDPGKSPVIWAAGATRVDWVDADGAVHPCDVEDELEPCS